VRHKKLERNSYLKGGTKKWRKTHNSGEAQKSEEKLIPEVRHKKKKKTHT
jgi:ribose 1,5-bisphosphokinase PhnN